MPRPTAQDALTEDELDRLLAEPNPRGVRQSGQKVPFAPSANVSQSWWRLF